jgi:hypothetical protein
MTKVILFIAWVLFLPLLTTAQKKDSLTIKDSLGRVTIGGVPDTSGQIKVDTAVRRKHSPRSAAIRSAILPGLGQIYNKKYWKLPIVYTAVGIPIYLFFDNKKWYDRTRFALLVVSSPVLNADSLEMVHSQLKPLVELKAQGSLLRYRNEFRKNMDYSIIFTLLFWGLNIVDATVDAHLKGFNVSDDLNVQLKPALLPGNAAGLSLVFTWGRNNPKTISSPTHF